MGQMLIRNLDDGAVERLRQRARDNRTSVEEEARRLLSADRRNAETLDAEAKALRDRTGPLPGPSGAELIRTDRDRDDLR